MNAAAGAPIRCTREVRVDSRVLRIYDDLLPNAAENAVALSRAAFTRTEVARPETAEYKHWPTEIKLDALVQQPIFELTRRAGRLVIFDGAIKHAGRPPHRICYVPRYTMAIKFEQSAVARDDLC